MSSDVKTVSIKTVSNGRAKALVVVGLSGMVAYTAMYLLAVSPLVARALGQAFGW